MSLARALRAALNPELGIDLGTANTVIYERGTGVLVSEPSVVAFDERNEVIAVGRSAKEMDGRAPGRIRVVRPLHGGTISDFAAAHVLIKTLVDRALASRARVAPKVVACVPGCATDIECKAVEEAVRAAGGRATTFLPQAVAAALGAGLDVTTTCGKMVVDIGGGTTEVAVLALSGVVGMHSIKVGGDYLDTAIAGRLRAQRFVVGPLTAEALKIKLGYAGRPAGRAPIRISGFDLVHSAPRAREVSEELVGEAMAEGIDRITRAVWSVLEQTPPDLASDLLESGITLTGGGAQITGLAGELSLRTNVPTTVAPDPLECVARGAAEVLGSPTLMERLGPSADRLTRWYQSLRIGMRESYSP
ncbi:MAG: rod shape-determining protein [Candidatus Eremiobacteraeota bacterium]|nr:rod shape-determining protein [Candidatus Eremiobacteraeota bacterium]